MQFQEFVAQSFSYFTDAIIPRFWEMIIFTIKQRDTLEVLIPLVITLFLVQLYFGRHKNETLGWNTAYGNCIVLLFVTTHLGTYVFDTYRFEALAGPGTLAYYKTLIVIILGFTAIGLMFIDFFHALDKRLTFLLSSSTFITTLAFISVVLVYSDIPLDSDTFATSIFIFLGLFTFFKVFRMLIPPSEQAERYLVKEKVKRQEKIQDVKHDIIIHKNRVQRNIDYIKKEYIWIREKWYHFTNKKHTCKKYE